MNHLQCNTDFYQSAKLIASNWFSGYSKFFPCDAHFIVPYVRLVALLKEKEQATSKCVSHDHCNSIPPLLLTFKFTF